MTHKQYIISSTMKKVVFQILSINVNITEFEILNM